MDSCVSARSWREDCVGGEHSEVFCQAEEVKTSTIFEPTNVNY